MENMTTEIIPANSVLFKDVCVVLEKLDEAKSKEQEDILEKFINEIKLETANAVGKKNCSLFPILRLLLPDCEKRAYNLKEFTLGENLVKILSLSKQTRHAQKLLNYRSQNSDFSSVAYFVLKNLGVCHKSGCLNVGDVNDALNSIANAEIGNKRCVLDETFSYVIKNTTELQMKWFLRIVLKKLKIGMSSKRILNVFHPDAYEFYESCSNLSKVCEEFEEGNTRPPEMGIKLLFAVSPMLSEPLDVTQVSKYLHPDKTYQIENKFDGERFQIHMQDGVFAYFSRRGYPFSDKYGETYESGFLTPYLKDCFSPTVTNFIIDGEMMGWNKEKQHFGSKGMSYDIKKITEHSKYRPCFCVFDLLYYNGKSLVGAPDKGGVPLRERLKILDAMFRDKRGVIQHSERKEVKGSSDILEALNETIDKQEEGIVVKDIDSYYIANKRNAGWYKIKPEYTESTMTDLDLVIIGADEAQDKSSGRANSFHVACADTTEPGVPPHRWVCVGRVSTGLTNEQCERINKALEPHWTLTKTKPPPDSLYFNKKRPDLWLMPQHSCILQVRASELVRSTTFGAAYTLRFPRVERVRDDKCVEHAMTLQELNDLVDSKKPVNKLSKNQIGQDQITNTVVTSRKRTAKVAQVAECFKSKSSGDVEVVSGALHGRKVCVVSDDEDCRKMELVKIVESHAGKHSEDTGDVWCCIVGRRTQRARNLINSQTNDILTTTWLRSLPPSDTPCQITPLDALTLKQETILDMCMDYDSYGDSYREPIDETTLKRCFNKMDDSGIEMYLTKQEMLNLDKELFGDDDHEPPSFLRPCVIHALNYDSVNVILAKAHGATLCDIDSSDLTHLVVPRDTRREVIEHTKNFVNGAIVYEDWLVACLDNKKLVSEDEYKL